MLRIVGLIGAAALVLFGSSGGLRAETSPQDMVYVGLGVDDVFDSPDALVLEGEWRPAVRYWNFVAPLAGGFVTSEGSLYGYAGFGFDIPLTDKIAIMPFTSAGLYRQGGGPDLGQAVEFRSGLEVSYKLDGGSVIAGQVYHLSNASLADTNPGNNYLVVRYGLPLSAVAGLLP